MLHRLALRVVPSLTLSVTEAQVRKRKRLVMLVPGLVAFAVFRAIKQVDPLSDPLLLLGVSGLISGLAAAWAYRMGRETPFLLLWQQDGLKKLGWVIGWIGFAYGIQLSLLVLALLRVLVHYDFLRHPDGPAMMAVIIACTSVARDAFEIGHVRKLQQRGQPVLTFPDGAPLRALIFEQPRRLAPWVLLSGAAGFLSAVGLALLGEAGRSELGQFILVTGVAGSIALATYLAGEGRFDGRPDGLTEVGWAELFQFWWWPGLAFGATYYLVVLGIVLFVLKQEATLWGQGLMAGLVAGLMALYGYYLGHRRHHEDRIQQTVPSSLLRCPFVMGILSKKGGSHDKILSPMEVALGESGRQS